MPVECFRSDASLWIARPRYLVLTAILAVAATVVNAQSGTAAPAVSGGQPAAAASAPAASPRAQTPQASTDSTGTRGATTDNCKDVDITAVTVLKVERYLAKPGFAAGENSRTKLDERGQPERGAGGPQPEGDVVQLRDALEVTVSGLEKLVEAERCSKSRAKIVLFLDGRPVQRAFPYPPGNPKNEVLLFQLERREDSRALWTHVLGRPSLTDRYITVSVGLEDGYAVPPSPSGGAQGVYIRALPTGWLIAWGALLLLLLYAFLRLAKKSDVLRDPAPVAPQAPSGRPNPKPYSLARMQAAFWFFLVLISWAFLGLVTGDYTTVITPTALALMGISAATAIGSATIDDGKAAAWRQANPGGTFFGPPATGSWVMDILTDAAGVNFHRFQMATWTVVLGIVWVHDVWANLAMPEFSATLLGLMGISAGTYLGLKTTCEKPV